MALSLAPEVSVKHLTSETKAKAKNLTSEAEAEDLTPESKGWLSEHRRNNAGSQCSNGKKEEPERFVYRNALSLNAEGVRRGAVGADD